MKNFECKNFLSLCNRWEELKIYELGMQSILSKSQKIPIRNLKQYLLKKVTNKKMIIVYLEFFNDFIKTYKTWEKDFKQRYKSNYIESLPVSSNVFRIIYLKSNAGIGGALITARRQVEKGFAYIYE